MAELETYNNSITRYTENNIYKQNIDIFKLKQYFLLQSGLFCKDATHLILFNLVC